MDAKTRGIRLAEITRMKKKMNKKAGRASFIGCIFSYCTLVQWTLILLFGRQTSVSLLYVLFVCTFVPVLFCSLYLRRQRKRLEALWDIEQKIYDSRPVSSGNENLVKKEDLFMSLMSFEGQERVGEAVHQLIKTFTREVAEKIGHDKMPVDLLRDWSRYWNEWKDLSPELWTKFHRLADPLVDAIDEDLRVEFARMRAKSGIDQANAIAERVLGLALMAKSTAESTISTAEEIEKRIRSGYLYGHLPLEAPEAEDHGVSSGEFD